MNDIQDSQNLEYLEHYPFLRDNNNERPSSKDKDAIKW